MLSILCEIRGFNPSISDMMEDPYCSTEQEENKTASICFLKASLASISLHGSQATSNKDNSDLRLNLAVAYAVIATPRTAEC
jgi:hypothetical protein